MGFFLAKRQRIASDSIKMDEEERRQDEEPTAESATQTDVFQFKEASTQTDVQNPVSGSIKTTFNDGIAKAIEKIKGDYENEIRKLKEELKCAKKSVPRKGIQLLGRHGKVD